MLTCRRLRDVQLVCRTCDRAQRDAGFQGLEAEELPALLAALDPESCMEVFGLDSMEEIEEALGRDDTLTWVDGRAWVDYGVWESAHGLEIWDMLGIPFGMVGPRFGMLSAISLGGPLDTSWSPEAVLEPIIRRRLALQGATRPHPGTRAWHRAHRAARVVGQPRDCHGRSAGSGR